MKNSARLDLHILEGSLREAQREPGEVADGREELQTALAKGSEREVGSYY